jgi:hypothetical protein
MHPKTRSCFHLVWCDVVVRMRGAHGVVVCVAFNESVFITKHLDVDFLSQVFTTKLLNVDFLSHLANRFSLLNF